MTTPTTRLRPGQKAILGYQGGRMGISAVPGSGKTWTLAYLAANLIKTGAIEPDQEILVVTLINAAVDNFSTRIAAQLQQENLLPGFGYRVRTLHGLANDIVRERPDLAGLSTNYQIIDDVESSRIKSRVSRDWLGAHQDFFEPFLAYEEYQRVKVYEGKSNLPRMIEGIGNAFIRLAKDRELTPTALQEQISDSPIPLPFVQMGTDIYTEYQTALAYRGAVDFDDLIRLALRCLRSDPSLVSLLRNRWPYILEDEAQDSSRLQQEILSLLAGEGGNWVRVGDPNQAIYESFTTASPEYLLDFMARPDVKTLTLPESGRSTPSIIELANHFILWTQQEHPNTAARRALTPPLIQPTSPNDPQPNPPDCPECIHLVERELTPDQEVHFVVDAAKAILDKHPEKTIAILSPRNARAYKFADELKRRQIPYMDSLLQSTSATRLSTGAMANILHYLSDPQSSRKLSAAYQVWRRAEREDEENWKFYRGVSKLIQNCPKLEDYLWPAAGEAWLVQISEEYPNPTIQDELIEFRKVVQHWQGAVFLPIDQLLLTIAQDLFLDPIELALAHKLSTLLRQFSDAHPDWRLPEFTDELANIARNQRKYLGFSQEDEAFDPDRYPGKVVVATMHKAKGLEWDCVFLTSLNNYNFPSGAEYDQYQPEKWFVKDHLNLEAETINQLTSLIENDPNDWYQPGRPSLEARQEFIRERLRLLFVGVTRARCWLTATWNTGRTSQKNAPALAFLALINAMEIKQSSLQPQHDAEDKP
jgi:DNA helicase II / ATP-dependent DNA helicase PcrA